MHWLKTKRISTFTRVPYAGNPAWVIYGFDALEDDRKLLKLASELNPLSDTTFIFTDEGDADISLRFFSQSSEVKFSGHGTIAAYLAMENEDFIKLTEPMTLIKQKTKLGIQPIELRVKDKKIQRVTVLLPVPRWVSMPFEIKSISKFLGISPIDISDTGYPIKAVESGYLEVILPIKSLELLLDLKPNFQLMKSYCERFSITGIVAYTRETRDKNSTVHLRHFAPVVGINEDPASGGASASLGYYLVQTGIVPTEEITRIVVEQGHSMQRPGLIYVHIHTYKKEILRVAFGGQGVVTFEGRVVLP